MIELIDGGACAVPARSIEDRRDAGADGLANVEVDGVGFNLHRPGLDADLYGPGLVSRLFGTTRPRMSRPERSVFTPAEPPAARPRKAG